MGIMLTPVAIIWVSLSVVPAGSKYAITLIQTLIICKNKKYKYTQYVAKTLAAEGNVEKPN